MVTKHDVGNGVFVYMTNMFGRREGRGGWIIDRIEVDGQTIEHKAVPWDEKDQAIAHGSMLGHKEAAKIRQR